MGRRERIADYFRKRLRSERELKGWSQADMAKMLSDNGFHATTIAKIEAGDRTVRIDEATAIADLLGLSLDALLGRKGLEDDASHALSVLADEAIAASMEAMKIRDRLRRANDELAAHWDLKSYSMGEVPVGDDLPLEHARANMAADDCDEAIGHLCVVVERLNNIATTRSMTAQQVAEAVGEYERLIEDRQGAK